MLEAPLQLRLLVTYALQRAHLLRTQHAPSKPLQLSVQVEPASCDFLGWYLLARAPWFCLFCLPSSLTDELQFLLLSSEKDHQPCLPPLTHAGTVSFASHPSPAFWSKHSCRLACVASHLTTPQLHLLPPPGSTPVPFLDIQRLCLCPAPVPQFIQEKGLEHMITIWVKSTYSLPDPSEPQCLLLTCVPTVKPILP